VANLIWFAGALLAPLLWLLPLGLGHAEDMGPGMHSLLAGLSIVGAAFLLSWATELAEEYVPPAFALIVLALISVLPEYAVDIHFAWMAGKDATYQEFAVANMTGANRLLIGVGWTVMVFVQYFRWRKPTLEVEPGRRLEMGILLLASLYALSLPLKGSIGLVDSAVFVAIFMVYVFRSLKSEHEEHDLVGPAAMIHARTGTPARIAIITALLAYAGATIWFCAEPFAEGLVSLGKQWQIDQFILVQLVAPLASEAPEFIVAILFVLRDRASTALGVIVSSTVNQWTLLVGAIPIAFSLSSGHPDSMPLLRHPREEILLTAAQSLFGIAVLSDLRFGVKEALILFSLYTIPWFLTFRGAHYLYAGLYFVLLLWVGLGTAERRRNLARLLRLSPAVLAVGLFLAGVGCAGPRKANGEAAAPAPDAAPAPSAGQSGEPVAGSRESCCAECRKGASMDPRGIDISLSPCSDYRDEVRNGERVLSAACTEFFDQNRVLVGDCGR
jgi:cation:H+ antiporter